MGSGNDQHKNRITELEDNDAFKDQLFKDNLKTTEHEKWIQNLICDANTNLRTTTINEQAKDDKTGMQSLLRQVMTESFPNIGNKMNNKR